jgi:hypothetical protein
MMRRYALVGLFALAFGCGAAFAQEDEIIVTGSRLARFEGFQVPQIFMVRRADFALVTLEVRSDTRDLSQRRGEMREALRGLHARANAGQVSLALVDESVGIVREFTVASAEELIRADRRPDTSVLAIRLRTPVAPNDTLDTINRRVSTFVAAAPKPGRIEMESGDIQLSLVNPQQYRDPLLAAITADGRRIAGMLGQDYGMSLSGLERQIAWQRSGELELTMFIPYALSASAQP